MISEFLDMMPDTVTLEPWAGQTANTDPVYGASASYRAHIEVAPRLIRNAQGEEVVSTARVFLAPTPASVSALDRLTLPEGFQERQPPILRVSPVRDENGLHHWEIWT